MKVLNRSLLRDKTYPISLLFLIVFLCSGWQSAADDELGGGATLAMLMILPAWLLGFFLVRRAVIRYSQKMMNQVSDSEVRNQEINSQLPEQPAQYQPVLADISSQESRTEEIKEAIALREEMIQETSKLWKRKLLYVFFVFLGYVALPPLLVYLFTQQGTNADSYIVVVFFVFIYLILIVLQYFAFRKQFRALDNKKRFSLNYPVVGLLRRITHPSVERVLLNILILVVVLTSIIDILDAISNSNNSSSIYAGIALLIMAFVHRQLYIYLRQQAGKVPSLKLLILRVFGREKNNLFTFERLLNYWKHFGPTFTIIDPSYLYHHYRFLSARSLKNIFSVLVLIFILWMSTIMIFEYIDPQVGKLSRLELEVFTTSLMVLFAWWLFWQYWKYSMRKRFAENLDSIEQQFKRIEKKPRNWDLSHKNIHLNCYDNTWKIAVNSFVRRSDTILMDLRGFSEERQGCRYEVNFIIDTFPIQGIVFLVDTQSDKELIHQLIFEQWKDQWVESPNLKAVEPKVRIFVSEKEDAVDLQYLIDLLIYGGHQTKGIEKPVISGLT